MRDLQVAHATIAATTRGALGRTLWAMPRRDLLIVRADRCDLPAEMVHEHHHGTPAAIPETGTRIALSVIVNPVTDHDGARTVVPAAVTADWLVPRLRGSVAVDHLEVEDLGRRRGIRRVGRVVTVAWRAIHLTGVVVHPDTLHELVAHGLGRAKAYGCGLVLVGGAS